jgi:hypothetical protein
MPLKATRLEDQLRSEKTLDGDAPRRASQRGSRLEIALSPEQRPRVGEIAARISRDYREARFVVDSSFFDSDLDVSIWTALLSLPDRILVLPQVRKEIAGWIEGNPDHPAAAAVLGEARLIESCDFTRWAHHDTRALLYYVNLLAMRKKIYRAVEIDLEAELCRAPTVAEITRAKQDATNKLGVRASTLARKGARSDSRRDTYYTDEALTATAFLTAINERRTTVILTRDEDIFDQFYKLQWLLDSHYRGMLFADSYLANLSQRQTIPMPDGQPWTDAFAEGPNRLVSRSDTDLEAILPARARGIQIECWLVRSGESRLLFRADDTMRRLLEIKGSTGGLNTDRLLPRNCHIWLAPLPILSNLRGYAALVVDHRVSFAEADIAIPLLDINQAILTEERHQRIITGNLLL